MHECSTSKLSASNQAAGTNHHLLKCVARVIFFNILFLLGVSCKSTDTCAGLNTPGVTIPQGDIILESGSSLTIYCLLNQSHKASQGKNASDLKFYHNEKLLPPEFVDVLNSTAIKLYIKEPVPSYSMYYCRLRGDHGKDIAVCLNGVAVGYKPQEVQNFSCVSRNWQNLTCTWKKPVNYVNTSYKLTFRLPGRAGGRMHHACPLNMDEQKNYCFWDITTEPHYRQPYEYYYFTMTGRNIFGNLTTQYKFHHYAHVIPAPAEKLNIREYTPHSAFLEWHVPFPMQTFPPGLIHRVEYQSQWDKRDQWFTANTSRLNPHHPYQSFNLSNLKYANSLYDVRIYLKSPAAVGEDKWSWPTNTTFKTERDVPEMPPKTDIGSYEVSGGAPMYRDVYIYWQYIPEYLKNGDYFEYRIISVKENDQERSLVPNETTKAYAKFKGLTFNSYQFVVASANEKGLSREKSVVSVPSKRESPPEPKSFTKIDFGNGTYELSWKPQESNDDSKRIENYTIFWCDNERDRPYQCTGFLNWTHVPGNETLKSIVVPEKKIYQFAIAANSKNHSSGMVWASCTVIHNKVVGKMKSVWINRIGSTFIEVGWRLDCSDRIGTVQGFKIYYCPIVSPYNFSCKEPEKSTTVKGDPATLHGNVTNLKPYTTYMVAIAVITKLGEGSQSDPLYNTTLEAAPTPPPPAQISNVTNTSMVVTWEPPHSMNGALRYYEIHYGFHKKRIEMGTKEKDSCNKIHRILSLPIPEKLIEIPCDHRTYDNIAKQETLPMQVKLENLTSHMNYSVSVIACTVQCSEKSTPVTVQTDIGVPGEMDSPVVQFINSSLAVVTWKPPRERGGLLNYYEVKVVKMYEKLVNETYIYNTTANSSQIQLPECETDGYLKYRFSVRAVNIGNNNVTYKGNWSVPGETNCYRSVLPYAVIVFIWVCGFLVAGALAILVCYLGKKAWLRCKEMQVVEVKLPPGLAPNEKEKDNEYGSLNWPPIDTHHDHLMSVKPRSNTSADEELLLQKKEERHGRNPSGDSSGCSSAHESVSSSLTSGTQISSDSGTEVDQRPPSPDGVFPDSPTWEATSLRQRNVTSMRGDGNSSDGSSWDPYVKMGRSGSVNGRGGSSSVARSTPNLTDIESLGLTPGTSGIGYSCLGTWSSTGYISMPSSEEIGSGSGSGSGMVGGYCRVGLDGQPVQGQALSPQQQQQQQHHQIQMQPPQQPSQPNKGYVSLASMPSTSNSNTHSNLQQIHNMPQAGGYVAHQPLWSSAPKEATGSGKGYVMAGEMGSGGLLVDADQEDQGILDSLSSAEEQEDSLQSPESYCRLGLHPSARLPVSTQLGIGVTGRSDGTIEAVRERAQKKPSSGYVTLSDISQPSTAGSAMRDERQASTNNSTVSGYVPHRQFEKRESVAQDHHTEDLYTKVFPPSDQGSMKSPTASV